MEILLNKREAEIVGSEVLTGTKDEVEAELTNAYYVWDDAPFPYWEKEKMMETIQEIASTHNLTIG